jgi:hypothetical protein
MGSVSLLIRTRPAMRRPALYIFVLLWVLAPVWSRGVPEDSKAAPARRQQHTVSAICSACIRAHEEFLASDALRGRGSGTHDEWVAATYIAAELRAYGIEPAGDSGGYLQRVEAGRPPSGDAGEEGTHSSWNVLGALQGANPALGHRMILLSAHLDHLGIRKTARGDEIYHGADDDASGVSAVLELARLLARRPRPRRTVIFAFFGSEEVGGVGSRYFVEHAPVPLADLSADLEFEMIGRPDPAVPADTLWLTGWNRSNLGPAMSAHGARLVADPHPTQDFFNRSDNYPLALQGIVAHTISSFGLHSDYHQPSDDLAHLDFHHLDRAIESLVGPIEWLVNSSFTPRWSAGGKP